MHPSPQTAMHSAPPFAEPYLALQNISLSYTGEQSTVVNEVSLGLQQGELGVLLGASGSGKSTILRAIAGFEPLLGGDIRLGVELLSSPEYTLAPEKRQVGMMFQDYALFPHLSVEQNIRYGLRAMAKDEAAQRVQELIGLLGLNGLQKRMPHELSGGQQQRVALARALAPKPKMLLLDEPFSSLDSQLRQELAQNLRDILKTEGMTALLVTHDQEEAFVMADRIGVLEHGRLLQWDSAYEIYHHPQSREVAEFIGRSSFLRATVIDEQRLNCALGVMHGWRNLSQNFNLQPGQQIDLLLRPDDIQHDDDSPVQAEVVHKIFLGALFLYSLRLRSGEMVDAYVPSHHDHHIGETIGIRLELEHAVAFPHKGF